MLTRLQSIFRKVINPGMMLKVRGNAWFMASQGSCYVYKGYCSVQWWSMGFQVIWQDTELSLRTWRIPDTSVSSSNRCEGQRLLEEEAGGGRRAHPDLGKRGQRWEGLGQGNDKVHFGFRKSSNNNKSSPSKYLLYLPQSWALFM